MDTCLKCGGEAGYRFRVLEVRTLPVRDLTGETRVQALGDFQTFAICETCADSQVAKAIDVPRAILEKGKWFFTVLAAGFILTAILWSGAPELRLLGPAAVLCGALGAGGAVFQSLATRREYLALSPEQQRERAVWEALLQAAPKKEGDNDLTYIPVTEKVLAMKNGDLMIEYDLLPAIAVQAWERLHEK